MKKTVAYFLIFLFVFSSCAIHRQFPYICFRKECVLGQLGYYEIKQRSKTLKKERQSKSRVRKRKREEKRDQKRNKRKKPQTDSVEMKSKSYKYSIDGSSGICEINKLIFITNDLNSDTIYVNYSDGSKGLNEDRKNVLKNYIDSKGAPNIKKVIIKSCHDRNILTEHEYIWLDERARKVSSYLKELNVPKAIVEIEE